MNSEDSFSMDGGIIVGWIRIFSESRESFSVMGNIESSITGSFKGSEYSISNSSVDKTNIKVYFEGSFFLDIIYNREIFSIDRGSSFVSLIKGNLFQKSSGD